MKCNVKKMLVVGVAFSFLSGCAVTMNMNGIDKMKFIQFESVPVKAKVQTPLTATVSIETQSGMPLQYETMLRDKIRESLLASLNSSKLFDQLYDASSGSMDGDIAINIKYKYDYQSYAHYEFTPISLMTLLMWTPGTVATEGTADIAITSKFSRDSVKEKFGFENVSWTGSHMMGAGDALAGTIETITPELIKKSLDYIVNSANYYTKIGGIKNSSQVAGRENRGISPVPVKVVVSDIDKVKPVKIKRTSNAYAIVIGIEQYRQKLPTADFAVNDAQIVTEYLTKALGFPEENVITLTNDHAALGDFVKYFEKWLPNNVEHESTVFVYYSGHGAPDPKTGGAYLVPYDGDPAFIDQTGYSLKKMYDALGKLPAKEVIVALDSCFSGAGGRSVLAKGARPLIMNLQSNIALPKNVIVLSAASGEQISSTYDEKGHGLFTYFLLKGIRNEEGTNPDGSLKIEDLYSYIKPQVERIARKQYNNEQTPQLIEPKKN